MRLVRRMGLDAARCFVSLRYQEFERLLPEFKPAVDASSLYPYEEGNIEDRIAAAAMRAAVPFQGPIPREVRDTLDDLLEQVAPRSAASVAAEYVIEHLLDRVARASYSYESEQVATAIVDELIDRACKGYYGGSYASWDVRVRNARTGAEWRLVVPVLLVKAEADAAFYAKRKEPGWLEYMRSRGDVQALKAKEKSEKRRQMYSRAKPVPNMYDISSDEGSSDESEDEDARRRKKEAERLEISSDEGSDVEDDAGVVRKRYKFDMLNIVPEPQMIALEVLQDCFNMATALGEARYNGQVLAEDLARQCSVMLSRLQLLPSTFPVSTKGPVELRLGHTLAEWRQYHNSWETVQIRREQAGMTAAEEEKRKYDAGAHPFPRRCGFLCTRGVCSRAFRGAYAVLAWCGVVVGAEYAAELQSEADNASRMTDEDRSMREYTRLSRLKEKQAKDPLTFHKEQVF